MQKHSVSLRLPQVSDFEFIYSIESDLNNQKYTALPGPSAEELMAFLASGQDYQLNGQIRLMILLDNEAVGMLDFFNADFLEGSAETGIIIVEAQRRKGIGPAAYRLGFRLCKEIGIRKLHAVVEQNNGPAIQLYHSLAFQVKHHTSQFFQFVKVI